MTKATAVLTSLAMMSGMMGMGAEVKELGRGQSAGALRGFGEVEWVNRDWGKGVEEMVFRAKSREGAETVLGKFLYDLEQSAGVEKVELSGVPGFVTHGGTAFVLGQKGAEARILTGARAEVEALLVEHAELGAGAVQEAGVPAFMKRFRYGVYGLGGLENFHNWMVKAGAERNELLDPREDLDFLRQMGNLRFDNWLEEVPFDVGDGLLEANGLWWKRKLAKEMGVQMAYRLYMPVNGYSWSARRFAKHHEKPAEWLTGGWLRYHQHQPHMSWYDSEIWGYFANETRKAILAMKDETAQGWMHPVGELVHQRWYDLHGDYSEVAQASWRAYLKKQGVTLEEASAMYSRGTDGFQSWDQVRVPEFATFAGLPGMVQDLAGVWYTKAELDASPAEASWWKKSPEERYEGLREGWYQPGVDVSDWQTLKMPGNWRFHDLYKSEGERKVDVDTCTRWFRRTFDWDGAKAEGKRVYLYFFPMARGSIHAEGMLRDEEGKPVSKLRWHPLYVNGQKMGDVGSWCALDVTEALKKGDNTVAFQLHGNYWDGRIFLSVQEPAVYPKLGDARNRMLTLWNQWRLDSKKEVMDVVFDAMRQADPNASIKIMAPITLGQPLTDQITKEWGAYSHFTGEGMWFFPWYKRYGKVYGVPGSSELAGPHETVPLMQRCTLRVFLAGLDAHEPVFLTQSYSRNPELREWWLERKEMLQRMGTYDIDGPQVLIYRRTALTGDSMPQPHPLIGEGEVQAMQNPWNWDVGRGSLQVCGQSYLYLDDNGIEDGKMLGHKVMFDGGNEILEAKHVEKIREWVNEGGVYVVWPFTGRSLPMQADAWPVEAVTGMKVSKVRALGGSVSVAEGADLGEFSGKTYEDRGVVRDYVGNNLNAYSVELEAGEGCEVLARYENGAAAIVEKKVGAGRVVVMGSVFWRDVGDVNGIWWPGATEEAFMRALLAHVEAEPAWCGTDNSRVWAQPYRSNNGLEQVVCVCNFNEEGVQRVKVTMHVKAEPKRVVVYKAGGMKEVAFQWNAERSEVVTEVELPSQEVCILNAEAYAGAESVKYWWAENQVRWRAVRQGVMDFSKYDEGEWKNPSQNLKLGAKWTATKPEGDAWLAAGFDDRAWTDCEIGTLQFYGAEDGVGGWVRKEFDLADAKWLEGGITKWVTGAFVGQNFVSKGRVFLNGEEILGWGLHRYVEVDVSRLLKKKGNVLAFEFEAGTKFAGLTGSVFLHHRAYPLETLELKDGWDAYGSVKRVYIPKEWEGKYRVRLYMEGPQGAPLGVRINDMGRYMRRHHHRFGRITDIDITNFLRFGEENLLQLGADAEVSQDGRAVKLSCARLELFAE